MNKTALFEFDDATITVQRVGENVGDIAFIEFNRVPLAVPFGQTLCVESSFSGRIRNIQEGVTVMISLNHPFRVVNVKEPNASSGESSEVAP